MKHNYLTHIWDCNNCKYSGSKKVVRNLKEEKSTSAESSRAGPYNRMENRLITK